MTLHRLAALLLAWGFCATVWAQDADAPTQTPPARAAPPSPSEAESRVQDLRRQLDQVHEAPQRIALWTQISGTYYQAGNVDQSLRVRDELIGDSQVDAAHRSLAAARLAYAWALRRDFPKSHRYIGTATSLFHEAKPGDLDTLAQEPDIAVLYAEAELARREQNRHDLALVRFREAADLAWQKLNDPSVSEKRRMAIGQELIGSTAQRLVLLLVMNNRRDEAMNYVSEIKKRMQTVPELTANPLQRANFARAEAIALCSEDDYDSALAVMDRAIATYRELNTPEFDAHYDQALRMRLSVALVLGTIGNYREDADIWMRGRAANPIIDGMVAPEEALALRAAANGQWSTAISESAKHIAQATRAQGPESPFVKYPTAYNLLYRLYDPQNPATQADIDHFVAGVAGDERDWADARFRGAYAEDGALSVSLGILVPRGSAPSAGAAALAFRISELLRSNSSQGALLDGAARLAANDPKLRSLIEQEQALRFERNSSRRAFLRAEGDKEVSPLQEVLVRQVQNLSSTKKRLEESDEKLKQLQREIAAQFPVYRELISPNIPSTAKLGAALRPDEIYLNLYSGSSSGFAFIVRPGGALTAVRLDIGRARTRSLIAALRKPFDATSPPQSASDPAGFDFEASHALYTAWIEPLKPYMEGAHTIYISAGGPFSNMPWNVLLTAPATSIAHASWWVKDVAPVQMPSASTLVLVRRQQAKAATRPFLAFADPSFNGQPDIPVDGTGRPVRAPPVPAESMSMRKVDYRQINRLPETLEEVRSVGSTLQAGSDSIISGVAASRSRVMKEDLSDVRVVEFATHGLLPEQVPGVLDAGLAMAYEGKGFQDSVLTINDVVGLRLNADWVVLSACNTGYATGYGGDSMSALLRGFFAAGTRTVMATQWAVESQSAKELVVQTFEASRADPTRSKIDSLVSAQRDMIDGKAGELYRHPYFWAAYFASGDAAR